MVDNDKVLSFLSSLLSFYVVDIHAKYMIYRYSYAKYVVYKYSHVLFYIYIYIYIYYFLQRGKMILT